MTSKELYKKDRQIIRELAGRNRIIGDIYFFINLAIITIAVIFGHKKDNFMSGFAMINAVMFWMPYMGFFLRVSGFTVYTGVKNSSAARETFKGSVFFLDTLSGIPVRRESVFRYVMEGWYMMVFIYLLCSAVSVISAVTADPRISLSAVMVTALYFLFTAVMFFYAFAVTIKSKAVKKLLSISVIALMLLFTIYSLGLMFIGIIDETGEFGWLDGITGVVKLSPAAAVIILIAAVIYPAAMELVFKKKILTKKEAGWYE